MKGYGKTLKKIRESLLLTQIDMSTGIMSQSNYSKVEKGEIDIPFSKMIDLLNRLGMSVDEFIYIHHDYTKIPGTQLNLLYKMSTNDKTQVSKNIEKLKKIKKPDQRDHELLAILEAMLFISEHKYDMAKEKAYIVWKRLEKHDNWYLYDIKLINSILYVFPVDIAESIVSLSIKRLKSYANLKSIKGLSANMQLNYLLLLIENKRFEQALERANTLISYCIAQNLYQQLSLCYIRKGIILTNLTKKKHSEWYQKGFNILEETNNKGLIQELKDEIKHYTD